MKFNFLAKVFRLVFPSRWGNASLPIRVHQWELGFHFMKAKNSWPGHTCEEVRDFVCVYVCVCVYVYIYTRSWGSEIRSEAPRSGFLSLVVFLCFSAILGGVGKRLCLRRLKWDCKNIFIKLFCVSVFKYRFSVCNFLYWFIIRNSFHVCCTTNSSIYQWLICLFSTKKQPDFKIHLYIELTETCQCLKLSHHESFLFFFSFGCH